MDVFSAKSISQDRMYATLNSFSQNHKNLGRLFSIPVSILDVTLETMSMPLAVVESVALVAIHLIGAAFSSENCTLKRALHKIEDALDFALMTPATFVMAPIKIIFQFFVIIINPEKAKKYHNRLTFGC